MAGGRVFDVLDAFTCQGGATKGYMDAGLRVIGVDKDPQPRYVDPDRFFVADAVRFIREHGHRFHFIHASPPCQHDSACQRIMGNSHPDLIGPTREALESTGRPWVLENVGGALEKLRDPVMVCGPMLGVETYRHRYFEAGGGFVLPQLSHPAHTVPQAKMGRRVPDGWYGQYVGNFTGVDDARRVMGVPWMNRDGVRECIPPAYAQWVGEHFIRQAS